ncbi:hypothetical protein [Corticicoccus populi]|uniref:Lipocalin-like domain-containing protein n=1 Tax=Corticicoccus populi TaxID=1812821 RepID=A0ABW5WXN3_9STAP
MTDLSSALPGTWIIKGTTFPMWTSGKRLSPAITYTLKQSNPLKFFDLVTYTNKNKIKEIKGIDHFREGQFVWRGNGILKLLKSKWEVIFINDDLLIIQFQSSLVTPSGLDILTRKEHPDFDVKKYVENNLPGLNLTEEMLESVEWL